MVALFELAHEEFWTVELVHRCRCRLQKLAMCNFFFSENSSWKMFRFTQHPEHECFLELSSISEKNITPFFFLNIFPFVTGYFLGLVR